MGNREGVMQPRKKPLPVRHREGSVSLLFPTLNKCSNLILIDSDEHNALMQNKIIAIATILAISMSVMSIASYNSAMAQTTGGSVQGSETGTVAGAVTKTVELNNDKILTVLWTATGGNFGSKFGLVSVSVDNSAFILVDNVSLSTNTKLGKYYSDSTKATTVAINPATFPFVKLQTSAGNTGVTETITWQAVR